MMLVAMQTMAQRGQEQMQRDKLGGDYSALVRDDGATIRQGISEAGAV